jgi:Na+/serine symporter
LVVRIFSVLVLFWVGLLGIGSWSCRMQYQSQVCVVTQRSIVVFVYRMCCLLPPSPLLVLVLLSGKQSGFWPLQIHPSILIVLIIIINFTTEYLYELKVIWSLKRNIFNLVFFKSLFDSLFSFVCEYIALILVYNINCWP